VGISAGSREVPGRNACDKRHPYRIIIIIMPNTGKRTIQLKYTIECVHSNTATYARKQRYSWTENTGMNMCQNQEKQVKEAR